MLKDLLTKIQSELCGSVNGGLDALSKLDVHRDDWLPQAVRNCRIQEKFDDERLRAPLSSQDIEELQKVYATNNQKFVWYTENVVNPGRVALLANELDTADMKGLEKQVRGAQEGQRALKKQEQPKEEGGKQGQPISSKRHQ